MSGIFLLRKPVDYFRAMRNFDKNQGKAPDDFDFPLKSSEEPDGGVDYLSVSRKWKEYLDSDQSDLIHNGEKGYI